MKKRIGYLAMIAVLMSAIAVATSAQPVSVEERYAVGGEIIPITASPYLFSPAFLMIIAVVAAVIVAGGALLTGKITIEFIPEN